MCGIFGFISSSTDQAHLESATNKLESRGPDSFGYFFDSPVGLGHRRLSIIDLSTGAQPMVSEDKQLVIVFNGEIYNFLKIKNELLELQYSFSTQSDTEVILKAYQAWGLQGCLDRLEGMFAFALWDESCGRLFVVRDRFGEKPLYFTQNQRGIFFASELKALSSFFDKTKISIESLNLFFSLTYIPAPFTIYEDVYKLEAGYYLTINKNGEFTKECYYDLLQVANKGHLEQFADYSVAQKELRELLFNSVKERMMSDVPLGSFLSGGIDSSIVSAIMAKCSATPIKTFSIGFKEKDYDESERAAVVANHISSDHNLYILDHLDLLKVVDETLAYFDEPFGDSSAIPSMMVAKKAKGKVTVVLTGDCADELFGGYEKYLGKHYAERYNKYPKLLREVLKIGIKAIPHTKFTNHTLRKIKKVIRTSEFSPEQRYLSFASLGYNNDEKEKLFIDKYIKSVEKTALKYFNQFEKGDELSKTFYSDVKLVLEGDMLQKVDRACMINSIEGRIPFLDSKIVEFSFKTPHDFKINGTNKKRILKETFADLLPPETLTFSKRGFGIPLRIWFKNELNKELLDLLNKETIFKQGIFNWSYIEDLLNEHLSSKENHSSKIWLLFVFQKWYFRNIEIN